MDASSYQYDWRTDIHVLERIYGFGYEKIVTLKDFDSIRAISVRHSHSMDE